MNLERKFRRERETGEGLSNGKRTSVADETCISDNFCDSCAYFCLKAGENPYGDEVRGYCNYEKKAVTSDLRPYEAEQIVRPFWCPKMKR